MKLLKNPVVALLLCLALIFSSTCLNAKIGLEKKYDRVCDELCEEMVEYADKNKLDTLRAQALTSVTTGNYSALISSYNEVSGLKGTDDVNDAIRDYNKFLRKTTRFPAKMFVDFLNIQF